MNAFGNFVVIVKDAREDYTYGEFGFLDIRDIPVVGENMIINGVCGVVSESKKVFGLFGDSLECQFVLKVDFGEVFDENVVDYSI